MNHNPHTKIEKAPAKPTKTAMPKFLSSSTNGPSKDELKSAIVVCLKENPNADAKTVKSLLKQSNPTWGSIPERRVKKILAASADVKESATTKKPAKRFSFVKGGNKLFAKAPAVTIDDTATAPLDSPPAEAASVVTKASAAAPATEPLAAGNKAELVDETLDKAASQEENMYKDDNDGKRNDCAFCQSCAVM